MAAAPSPRSLNAPPTTDAPVTTTEKDPAARLCPTAAIVGSTQHSTSAYALPWVREMLEGRGRQRAPTFELHPGLVVPETRCRIVRWIADGGMGVVYEAVHEELGRAVALKVLRPEYSGRTELGLQFREEARAATRIGSEHIVQVHDFGTLPDGRFFFTMELLLGSRLSDHLAALDLQRVVGVLRQLCKGLAAAHDAGIVHRDLKPDNVMLTARDGRPDFVKILDFGLATMQGGDAGIGHAGTPWYMAPELILGLDIDHRVDIYALGCTAFELLTGRPPFADDDAKDVLMAHLERPPPSLDPLAPRPIPPAIEEVVMRCLAKDQQARYANMRALELALVEAQLTARVFSEWDDLPLPIMAPGQRERIEAELRRGRQGRPAWRRRGIWGPAVAGLLGIGAATVALWPAEPEITVSATDDRMSDMMIAARAAAAKANFVYPPADGPSEPTAFTRVLELERLDDLAAIDAARVLRVEFAGTLVRLGDEYWDADGGQPFAIDYYAQAQLFTSLPVHAAGRLILTPGELASLRIKATDGSFTEAELIAAEPLAVLAQPDPQARAVAHSRLARRVERRSALAEQRLDRLIAREREEPAPSSVTAQPAPVAPLTDDAETRVAVDEPAGEASVVRDPKRAANECAAGEAALRDGRIDMAESAFERALDLDRRAPRALIGLSDVHFERASYGKAVQWAVKAVAAAPWNPAYRVRLGDAYYKVQRYREAETAYAKAAELGDGSASSRLEKVRTKIRG